MMGVAELAAYYKSKGITLYEAMTGLYEKYGYYKETLQSITLKGIEGIRKIKYILSTLRNNPPTSVNGIQVMEARDYKAGNILTLATGAVRPTELPSSDVLYYDLEDNAWFCVRPSGTEPKVKFYFGVKGESMDDAGARSKALEEAVMDLVSEIIEEQ